jgi:hypothetical protein
MVFPNLFRSPGDLSKPLGTPWTIRGPIRGRSRVVAAFQVCSARGPFYCRVCGIGDRDKLNPDKGYPHVGVSTPVAGRGS